MNTKLESIDKQVTGWMARNGVVLLRMALAIVYLWFGALKFFPDLSPAELLAGRTIEALTLGVISARTALPLLALWECAIGICLFFGIALRAALLLLFLQMIGTLTPLFLFYDELFKIVPFIPTLEGQYILKNMVLISAAIIVGATVRGGAVIGDAQTRQSVKTELSTKTKEKVAVG